VSEKVGEDAARMKSPLWSSCESQHAFSETRRFSRLSSFRERGTRDASSVSRVPALFLYRGRWTHIFRGHCRAGAFDWNPCVSVITEASAS